jgi:rhodanese-related sulfurtransferase
MFMKNIQIHPFVWLIAFSLLLVACGSPSTPQAATVTGEVVSVAGGSYIDIDVPQLQAMLADKDFTFVNVHIPFEGDIANTDLSIPFDEIDRHLDRLPAEKDAKIVLYCRSGRMSAIAAETLVGLGYTNVSQLKGGMLAWEQAGLPIEGK